MDDHDLLLRLEVKVDGLLTRMQGIVSDHEERIRSLERARWAAAGAAALVGALSGQVFHR